MLSHDAPQLARLRLTPIIEVGTLASFIGAMLPGVDRVSMGALVTLTCPL